MNKHQLGLILFCSLFCISSFAYDDYSEESYDSFSEAAEEQVEYGLSIDDDGSDDNEDLLSPAMFYSEDGYSTQDLLLKASNAGHRCPGNISRTLQGEASFYGGPTNRYFEGRRTACGNVFNSVELTAALPQRMLTRNGTNGTVKCGTWDRVTNSSNGRSIWVRLNDTGSFARYGRIIDLSHGAAYQLGFVSRGHTNVNLEICSSSSSGQRISRNDAI